MRQNVKGLTRSFPKVSGKVLGYLIFAILSVYSLTPFVWLVTSAFHPNPSLWLELPKQPTLSNFVRLFTREDMPRWLINSSILATMTMILVVTATALAGYTLSRLDFPGKDVFMTALLMSGFMPWIARMIPTYKLCISLGLMDNLLGVALVVATSQLPTMTWIMKGFFDGVPRELEEQAWICGSTRLGSLFRLVFPLAGPGVAVVALLSFLGGWSNFTVSLILLHSETNWTMSLGIARFFGEMEAMLIDFGPLTAMAFIYIIPPLIVLYLARKHLMKVKLTRMEVR